MDPQDDRVAKVLNQAAPAAIDTLNKTAPETWEQASAQQDGLKKLLRRRAARVDLGTTMTA